MVRRLFLLTAAAGIALAACSKSEPNAQGAETSQRQAIAAAVLSGKATVLITGSTAKELIDERLAASGRRSTASAHSTAVAPPPSGFPAASTSLGCYSRTNISTRILTVAPITNFRVLTILNGSPSSAPPALTIVNVVPPPGAPPALTIDNQLKNEVTPMLTIVLPSTSQRRAAGEDAASASVEGPSLLVAASPSIPGVRDAISAMFYGTASSGSIFVSTFCASVSALQCTTDPEDVPSAPVGGPPVDGAGSSGAGGPDVYDALKRELAEDNHGCGCGQPANGNWISQDEPLNRSECVFAQPPAGALGMYEIYAVKSPKTCCEGESYDYYPQGVEPGYTCCRVLLGDHTKEGGGCLAGGTFVEMRDHSAKDIEKVAKGDRLWNPVKGKAYAVREVTTGAQVDGIFRLRAGTHTLTLNADHPVWTARGVVPTHKLRLGDSLRLANGSRAALESLVRIPPAAATKVFNVALDAPDSDKDAHLFVSDGIVTGDLVLQRALAKNPPL